MEGCTTALTAASSPSRSDWRLSPDEGDWLSGLSPDGGDGVAVAVSAVLGGEGAAWSALDDDAVSWLPSVADAGSSDIQGLAVPVQEPGLAYRADLLVLSSL